MGYSLTTLASRADSITPKNRGGDFFPLSSKTHPANRRQPTQPRRKIRATPTKPVSGIPYWPSRDPIEEKGGLNLYGFVGNDGVTLSDALGRERSKTLVTVNFYPPDPTHIWPTESSGDSGTRFDEPMTDRKFVCECKCDKENRHDKNYYITCTVAFPAKIALGKNDIGSGENQSTWLFVYGHEQKHVVSTIKKVQAIVNTMLTKKGGPFTNKSTCDDSKGGWETRARLEFNSSLIAGPNVDHAGDPTATSESPVNARGYPPLVGTSIDIYLGLMQLDRVGYGLK